MTRAAFLTVVMSAWALAPAIAQDAPRPNHPPGFDCATLPAGDEREACRQSGLNPKAGSDQNDGRSVTGAGSETPGTVSPPTFPDEPGSENRDSGPGTDGGAGGVGN
jgi:hypothetical protein